jgi:hypothetical protein
MNPEDVGKLSTTELDALIAAAVKERTKRPDPHPLQPPKEFEATVNPAWFVFLVGESTIIQFRHAGHGWVSIAIPPPERAHLASLLMHHSLLGNITKAGEQKPDAAPPVPPGQGGGTVH